MIERIMGRFPEAWRELIELAAAPIAWLPGLQHMAIRFFFDSPSGWAATAKFVFLLLPILLDRKSTRLNSSHLVISYAVFCLKKKKKHEISRANTAQNTSPYP